MRTTTFDITAIGELLIDFTPIDSGNTALAFAQHAGGAPANLLATVARFGGKTAMISKVGSDMFGRFLIKTLSDSGVDTQGICVDQIHNTTLAFVALDEKGDRDFSFYRKFGADVFLAREDVDETLIRNARIFHFGSLSLTDPIARDATDYAISVARESGCILSFDPNYRAPLWKSKETAIHTIKAYIPLADIIKFSKEEIEMLTGIRDVKQAIAQVLAQGARLVLVTDGANGVIYASKAGMGFVPSISVNTVDTTGAGDIFFGTFLYAINHNRTAIEALTESQIRTAVNKAVLAAGLSTTKKGAIPSIPSYTEVFAK